MLPQISARKTYGSLNGFRRKPNPSFLRCFWKTYGSLGGKAMVPFTLRNGTLFDHLVY